MRAISSTLRPDKAERPSGKRLRFDRIGAPFIALLMLIISGGYTPRPIADPCPTPTGQITRLTVPSTVYGQAVPVSVYLPPCAASLAKRLPAIYLLHGASADETQWPDLRVQTEADALMAAGAQPFAVIMPGGVYRWDVDYASFVLDDVIPALTDRLNLRIDAAGRAIGGLSLGGYWALKLAFQQPDHFAAVGGYSPVVVSRETDLVALAGTAAGLDQLHIALDVGRSDALAVGTQQLVQALRERGLTIALTLNDGGHNRPYWRAHTAEYLRFLLTAIGAPAPSHVCYSH